MIPGWCAPPAAWNEWTTSLFRWSMAESVKLFPFQIMQVGGDPIYRDPDPALVNRLRLVNPSLRPVIRMHDSFWSWQNRMPSAREYGQAQAHLAAVASSMGINLGQFDCEPNYRNFNGEWDYRIFFQEAFAEFDKARPAGFQVIFPPMMIRWDSRWKAWYTVCSDVARGCDFIGVDLYWQDPVSSTNLPAEFSVDDVARQLVATGSYDSQMPQRYHESLGWAHAWLHRLIPERQLVVCEVNSSWSHKQPTPAVAESFRASTQQVPEWAVRANRECPYLESYHVFTLPGTGEGMEPWMGFVGTKPLARALGRATVCY